jgi:hypothetical protein
MRLQHTIIENRRDFLRSAGRYAFAGLLVLAGEEIVRRRLGGRESCMNQGICSGCAVLPDCGLPQALSARQALPRGPE